MGNSGLVFFFLGVFTAILAVAVAYLISALRRLTATLEESKRTLHKVGELSEKLDRLADEASVTLASVRRASDAGAEILEGASEMTSQMKGVMEEAMEQFSGVLQPLRYLSVLVAGVKSGLQAVAGSQREELTEGEPPKEDADEA